MGILFIEGLLECVPEPALFLEDTRVGVLEPTNWNELKESAEALESTLV